MFGSLGSVAGNLDLAGVVGQALQDYSSPGPQIKTLNQRPTFSQLARMGQQQAINNGANPYSFGVQAGAQPLTPQVQQQPMGQKLSLGTNNMSGLAGMTQSLTNQQPQQPAAQGLGQHIMSNNLLGGGMMMGGAGYGSNMGLLSGLYGRGMFNAY